MRIKKALSEAQLAQRRANAAAARMRPHKQFVTVRMEKAARDLIRAYVADRANKCRTISDAIRTRFNDDASG